MAAGQKEERPVLAAVGRLELVPQAELPLVLQLQPDDGLTQGASVLADHAQGGTCGYKNSFSVFFACFFPASKRRPLVITCLTVEKNELCFESQNLIVHVKVDT